MQPPVDDASSGPPACAGIGHPGPAAVLSPDFLLDQMAATVQEVFWISPPDLSALLFASPGFERVWGVPWEQAPHPPAAVVGATHPEDLARVLREIRSVRDCPRDIEYRILRPDGGLRWVRNRVRKICDESGRLSANRTPV